MYKKVRYEKTTTTSVETVIGETLEQKIERIIANKEPIKDGAPEIFTERKDGIIAAYNIRTDRFEIAAEAMDKVHRSKLANRESKPKMEVVKNTNEKDGGAESVETNANG